jgi:hypothetical protein
MSLWPFCQRRVERHWATRRSASAGRPALHALRASMLDRMDRGERSGWLESGHSPLSSRTPLTRLLLGTCPKTTWYHGGLSASSTRYKVQNHRWTGARKRAMACRPPPFEPMCDLCAIQPHSSAIRGWSGHAVRRARTALLHLPGIARPYGIGQSQFMYPRPLL